MSISKIWSIFQYNVFIDDCYREDFFWCFNDISDRVRTTWICLTPVEECWDFYFMATLNSIPAPIVAPRMKNSSDIVEEDIPEIIKEIDGVLQELEETIPETGGKTLEALLTKKQELDQAKQDLLSLL